ATRAPVGPAPSLPLYIRGSRANGLGLPKARGLRTAMCAPLAAILAAASARAVPPLPAPAATPEEAGRGGSPRLKHHGASLRRPMKRSILHYKQDRRLAERHPAGPADRLATAPH